MTTLIGESGCGKTTLARSLINLLPQNILISSGTILFNQLPVPVENLKKLRGGSIFYIPQDATASLNPVLKIQRQITECSKKKIDHVQLIKLLAQLNISNPDVILNSYPFQLSGGENQRCLLAMAILQEPQLLILDEPTSSLDPASQDCFFQLIRQLQALKNMSIFLITHNLSISTTISDYLYIMHQGKIVDSGIPTTLFTTPKHTYTQEIAKLIKNQIHF